MPSEHVLPVTTVPGQEKETAEEEPKRRNNSFSETGPRIALSKKARVPYLAVGDIESEIEKQNEEQRRQQSGDEKAPRIALSKKARVAFRAADPEPFTSKRKSGAGPRARRSGTSVPKDGKAKQDQEVSEDASDSHSRSPENVAVITVAETPMVRSDDGPRVVKATREPAASEVQAQPSHAPENGPAYHDTEENRLHVQNQEAYLELLRLVRSTEGRMASAHGPSDPNREGSGVARNHDLSSPEVKDTREADPIRPANPAAEATREQAPMVNEHEQKSKTAKAEDYSMDDLELIAAPPVAEKKTPPKSSSAEKPARAKKAKPSAKGGSKGTDEKEKGAARGKGSRAKKK
jgi:hypothetical protein